MMSSMRYDCRSVKVTVMSDLHGTAVAQVPANGTRSHQSPTHQCLSKYDLDSRSHHNHRGRPPKDHIVEETSSRQQHDEVYRPHAACQHSSRPVNCRAQRGRSYSICMLWRCKISTRWLMLPTWDLDLPPLIRPSRTRWWPPLRRFPSPSQ